MDVPDRVRSHVAAFNSTVREGDWGTFGERFAEDATLSFRGVPVGPFVGRDAIVAAYEQQPPDDTMAVLAVEREDEVDVVAFGWTAGGGGTMRIGWADQRVAALEVSFG